MLLFVVLLTAGVTRSSKPKAEGQPEAEAEFTAGQASELDEPAKDEPMGEQSARPVVLIKDSRAEAQPRLEAVSGLVPSVKKLAAIVDTAEAKGLLLREQRM